MFIVWYFRVHTVYALYSTVIHRNISIALHIMLEQYLPLCCILAWSAPVCCGLFGVGGDWFVFPGALFEAVHYKQTVHCRLPSKATVRYPNPTHSCCL